MKQVTITGFEPTFDVVHFEAMHRNFSGRVMRGEISIDDAVSAACSASYDPATLYNTLQPHLAARHVDRRVLALRAGIYILGVGTGFAMPYAFTDDPGGLVLCGSTFAGALVAGFVSLGFIDEPLDSPQEYDLAYDHIDTVVAALERKYDLCKPLAEELVPSEGGGNYKVLRSRRVEPGTGFVENTVRYSLSDSRYSVDLFIVNGVPEKISIQTGRNAVETQKTRALVLFTYDPVDFISFPQATVETYQAAIQQYGRLTLRN